MGRSCQKRTTSSAVTEKSAVAAQGQSVVKSCGLYLEMLTCIFYYFKIIYFGLFNSLICLMILHCCVELLRINYH